MLRSRRRCCVSHTATRWRHNVITSLWHKLKLHVRCCSTLPVLCSSPWNPSNMCMLPSSVSSYQISYNPTTHTRSYFSYLTFRNQCDIRESCFRNQCDINSVTERNHVSGVIASKLTDVICEIERKGELGTIRRSIYLLIPSVPTITTATRIPSVVTMATSIPSSRGGSWTIKT